MGLYGGALSRTHAALALAIVTVLTLAGGAVVASEFGPVPVSRQPAPDARVNEGSPEIAVVFDEDIALVEGAGAPTIVDAAGVSRPGVTSALENPRKLLIQYTGPLPDGGYTVTIPEGHVSRADLPMSTNATITWKFQVDTVASPPVVAAVDDPVNLQKQSAVAVAGTSEPGSTVTVEASDGVKILVSAPGLTANQDGQWDTTLNVTDLADGPLTVSATATDLAGNTSPRSAPRHTRKDATPPTVRLTVPAGAVSATSKPGIVLEFSESVRPTPYDGEDGVRVRQGSVTLVHADSGESVEGVTGVVEAATGTLHVLYEGELDDGDYTVSVAEDTVRDTAENPNDAASLDFSV
ncbi:MAG TPA: Ig-like domain-containing protein, partial [Egibacteraceae bacterium]|nr:Ig-like domain-containing protein [Egibacteraceae bacterium]